ncbi:hypothetical protein N9545_04760 [Salibacteraceae bacterium]|nr:hypothetical protein [Salibacteraceae bacterium]MDB9708867.1 hypothetical protein [Salibacteraceae bacterium]MDC1304655.1 hypothetical protein [Salibacteraceae bacterium]
MARTLSILLVLLSSFAFSQTITSKPIYKGSQYLTIDEFTEQGDIYFGYQNPKYTAITDIISFSVESKSEAIALMNEALKLLEMEKTDKDQHIRHSYAGVEMVRYGFHQKSVTVDKLPLSKKEINLILDAMESYTYKGERNVSE